MYITSFIMFLSLIAMTVYYFFNWFYSFTNVVIRRKDYQIRHDSVGCNVCVADKLSLLLFYDVPSQSVVSYSN